MTAEVNIIVAERPDALLIPATAVSDGQVWVARDGRLRRQPVQTGVVGEDKTEILAGLSEIDRVAIRPAAKFQEGQRVRER